MYLSFLKFWQFRSSVLKNCFQNLSPRLGSLFYSDSAEDRVRLSSLFYRLKLILKLNSGKIDAIY